MLTRPNIFDKLKIYYYVIQEKYEIKIIEVVRINGEYREFYSANFFNDQKYLPNVSADKIAINKKKLFETFEDAQKELLKNVTEIKYIIYSCWELIPTTIVKIGYKWHECLGDKDDPTKIYRIDIEDELDFESLDFKETYNTIEECNDNIKIEKMRKIFMSINDNEIKLKAIEYLKDEMRAIEILSNFKGIDRKISSQRIKDKLLFNLECEI